MGQLFHMLTAAERTRGLVVLVVLIAMAAVEVVGVAAIAAFIALLTNPGAASGNRWLLEIGRQLGSQDGADLLLPAGLALFAVIVFRNFYSAFASWSRLSYLHHLRKRLATRLLASYLAQPYAFFLRANSATLVKNLTFEVNQLVTTYLYSWLVIAADALTTLAILGLLLYRDPVITAIAVGVLGTVALAVLLGSRSLVRALGTRHRALNDRLHRTATEAVSGIKELKVLGRERHFLDRFASISDRFAGTTVSFQLFNELPRYGLEIVVFGGMLLMAWLVVDRAGSVAPVAETLALFVVAFYRLLPITHRILSSASGLSFNHAILADLSENLRAGHGAAKALAPMSQTLSFAREIEFRGVRFRYDGASADALGGIDLVVPKNATIAFVGPTGVGKTTIVDLMLGLHRPTGGAILVDGVEIAPDRVRAWRANVGYVPQAIYLADDTIRRNIALGVSDADIDEARIATAARMAQLDRFVETLPDKYGAMVGERGVRLSGGQRQRIGIARALYGRANVLILDEATSALDGITEAVIEESIAGLRGQATVVIIAHRLSTVRHCDRIYLLENGRVAAAGGYDELMRDNSTFRAMARAV